MAWVKMRNDHMYACMYCKYLKINKTRVWSQTSSLKKRFSFVEKRKSIC